MSCAGEYLVVEIRREATHPVVARSGLGLTLNPRKLKRWRVGARRGRVYVRKRRVYARKRCVDPRSL